MTDDLLSAHARGRLREFTVAMCVTQPSVIASGARIADTMRQSFPSLNDEAIAAVLDAGCMVGLTYARLTGCPHLLGHLQLLQAAVADLAHLELDPPDAP